MTAHILATSLQSAIDAARADDPTRPVTVLCGPHARNDVVIALAQTGPHVGVTVATVEGFVRQAARSLSPRSPLPRRRIMTEVTRILPDEDSAFRDHEIHTETVTRSSLSDIVGRLLRLSPQARAHAGGAQLPREAARIAELVAQRTRDDYYTRAEAYAIAAAASAQSSHTAFISAGVIPADPQEQALIEALCPTVVATTVNPEPQPEMMTYMDPSEEIEAVFSDVAARARADDTLAAGDVAVVTPSADYLPELVRLSRSAVFPARVPAVSRWAQYPAIRTVLRLVSLDSDSTPRRALAELLESGYVANAPSAYEFNRFTRDRDIPIDSGEDWNIALTSDEDSSVLQWRNALWAGLQTVWSATTWTDLAARLRSLLLQTLRIDELPTAGLILDTVDSLASFDGELGAPTQAMVVEVLTDLWSTPRAAESQGEMIVGTLDDIVGKQLRHLYIVGASDAALPGSFTPDPAITAKQSGVDATWYNEHTRSLWEAALRSATTVQISFSRSSLDGALTGQPSGWVLQYLPSTPADYPRFERSTLVPLTEQGLKRIANGVTRPRTRFGQVAAARRGGERTELNGFVSTPLSEDWFDNPVSASALELYTEDPQEFFFHYLLRSKRLEDPAPAAQVSPVERGTVYHRIFEDWTPQVRLGDNIGTVPDEDEARAVLDRIVKTHLGTRDERYSATTWESFTQDVRGNVARWFEREMADIADGWIAVGAETSFGTSAPPVRVPITPRVGRHREVLLRGAIDRIDVRIDDEGGVHLRVTDYKSGTGKKYAEKLDISPVGGPKDHEADKGGYAIQLAIYGAAAQASVGNGAHSTHAPLAQLPAIISRFCSPGAPVTVTSRYWMFRDSDNPEVELRNDDATSTALRDFLTSTYTEIVSGHFPPTYEKKNFFYGFSDSLVLRGPTRSNQTARAIAYGGAHALDSYLEEDN
ncbi:PD-(D/E)XK nuclease family protein [Corynebacterium cystitidis]|uniref:PD-(D/E)XK nuclease family protein n=1 Tax=Corynebacterium cystitidis TaxID=35757 RepID=UPI00211F13B0|nr:PD-(D/E)XK nuclease family protein [Corynebacterium cystitidis]